MTDDWQIDFGQAHVVEIPLSILLLGDSTNAGTRVPTAPYSSLVPGKELLGMIN